MPSGRGEDCPAPCRGWSLCHRWSAGSQSVTSGRHIPPPRPCCLRPLADTGYTSSFACVTESNHAMVTTCSFQSLSCFTLKSQLNAEVLPAAHKALSLYVFFHPLQTKQPPETVEESSIKPCIQQQHHSPTSVLASTAKDA